MSRIASKMVAVNSSRETASTSTRPRGLDAECDSEPEPRTDSGRRAWPLMPLALGVVLVLGIAVAAAIGSVGLSSLAVESDVAAGSGADLLVATLAPRLSALPSTERLEVLQRTARVTGAELIVVTDQGDGVFDATLGRFDPGEMRRLVASGSGESVTGLGRVRYAVRPLDASLAGQFVIAFVRAPSAPEGGPALLRALVALTTLLVVVAAAVAYALTRDANQDVDFAARRVSGMVHVRSEPMGEAVPPRTLDEVGALTASFNSLVDRFATARVGYERDLERVHLADRNRAAFLAAVVTNFARP